MAGKHTHKHRVFCIRCILFTVGFPVEHFIWERTPYLNLIPALLGIH